LGAEVVLHSSDAIRGELFGDPGSQENNALVFETMHKRVKEDLRAGKTVIYDATNITRKARKGAINLAHPTYDTVECHVVWADPHECIRRDGLRDRKVGPEVINKMLRRWQSPWKDEGFDKIRLTLNQDNFDQVQYIATMTSNMHIPHDNPHHTLGVWEHCVQAQSNIKQIINDYKNLDTKLLLTAALWHDIGKPWTKGYKADKETGLINYSHAHYYDHHCVGGYLAYGLFAELVMYPSEQEDACFISWLVANHMEPFFESKYYKTLNSQLKGYIDALHAADLTAH
jgi:putative nucleotidyltransferase with HDIG domain